MYVSFRPGDGRRLEIGLALALKEAEKAQKALTAIALIPYPTQLLELRAELEGAASEVKRWMDESGDAPKMVDLADKRRNALHVGAYRYNTDTEKLLERKEKQGRDTSPEEEEIQKTSRLIDWLLGKGADKAMAEAREKLGDDAAGYSDQSSPVGAANGAFAEVVTGAQ